MESYYDRIWAAVPPERRPPWWAIRTGFCRSLVSPGQRVLDLGCGDGAMLPLIARSGAVAVGADPSRVALDRAAGQGDFELVKTGPGGSVPFEAGGFDGVWISEVLGQALDPGGVLDEARRLLRPGGWLGVTTPLHARLRSTLHALVSFERAATPGSTTLRAYSRRGLAGQLRGHGFEVLALEAAGGVPGMRRLLLARAVRP